MSAKRFLCRAHIQWPQVWSPIWAVATKPLAVTMELSVVKDAKCIHKGHMEKFDLQLSEQLRLHRQ